MNLIEKIKKFSASKMSIKPLKKVDVLIYDKSNVEIFAPYLKNLSHEILHNRMEKFNLLILLKLLMKFKKINMINYTFEFINQCKPKIIISFIDNNPSFYSIKNRFPEVKVIAIQNGMRSQDLFVKFKSIKDLKADYIFTWGKAIQEKYQSSLSVKNLIILGSFKNNLILRSEKKKRSSIAFISTGSEDNRYFYTIDEFTNKRDVPSKEFYKPEYILLPKILDFCNRNNKKLEIIGREKQEENRSQKEYEWYKKILGGNNFTFFEFGKKKSAYQISDEVELCVNIYSAFGLEAIARGTRVSFFHLRQKVLSPTYHCFWPGKINLKGDFWTDDSSQDEVDRVLNYSLKTNDVDWNNSIKKIIPNLITFDKDNKTFSDTIKKILNKY